MYSYEYVSKDKWKEEIANVISMIKSAQDILRESFTFLYEFTGSAKRNLITCDFTQNIGFDFDIDIIPNVKDKEYSPKKIKELLISAFNQVAIKSDYANAEDLTKVFTLKNIDHKNSSIRHSCDFAIINNLEDGKQQYIRNNKKQKSYYWEFQPEANYEIPEKENYLKHNNHWTEVKKTYLLKKNINKLQSKNSISIYMETIHNTYNKLINLKVKKKKKRK